MRRREFIIALSATATPLATAGAQQSTLPLVGLYTLSALRASLYPPFLEGLDRRGFVEGRNVAIERYTFDHYDQLAPLLSELVPRGPRVIVTVGSANMVRAAKSVTTRIPIVFGNGGDPVGLGLVASMNRPGGNVTGVSYVTGEIGSKRLELFHNLLPEVRSIGALVNPTNMIAEDAARNLQATAQKLGVKVDLVEASTEREIETAIGALAARKVGALLIEVDAFFASRMEQIVAFAGRHRLPTCTSSRRGPLLGGAMSYGDDRNESYRQIGQYTGRILSGEKPSDLPVLQPTKFEFVINARTLKSFGIEIPMKLLAIADEVIE